MANPNDKKLVLSFKSHIDTFLPYSAKRRKVAKPLINGLVDAAQDITQHIVSETIPAAQNTFIISDKQQKMPSLELNFPDNFYLLARLATIDFAFVGIHLSQKPVSCIINKMFAGITLGNQGLLMPSMFQWQKTILANLHFCDDILLEQITPSSSIKEEERDLQRSCIFGYRKNSSQQEFSRIKRAKISNKKIEASLRLAGKSNVLSQSDDKSIDTSLPGTPALPVEQDAMVEKATPRRMLMEAVKKNDCSRLYLGNGQLCTAPTDSIDAGQMALRNYLHLKLKEKKFDTAKVLNKSSEPWRNQDSQRPQNQQRRVLGIDKKRQEQTLSPKPVSLDDDFLANRLLNLECVSDEEKTAPFLDDLNHLDKDYLATHGKKNNTMQSALTQRLKHSALVSSIILSEIELINEYLNAISSNEEIWCVINSNKQSHPFSIMPDNFFQLIDEVLLLEGMVIGAALVDDGARYLSEALFGKLDRLRTQIFEQLALEDTISLSALLSSIIEAKTCPAVLARISLVHRKLSCLRELFYELRKLFLRTKQIEELIQSLDDLFREHSYERALLNTCQDFLDQLDSQSFRVLSKKTQQRRIIDFESDCFSVLKKVPSQLMFKLLSLAYLADNIDSEFLMRQFAALPKAQDKLYNTYIFIGKYGRLKPNHFHELLMLKASRAGKLLPIFITPIMAAIINEFNVEEKTAVDVEYIQTIIDHSLGYDDSVNLSPIVNQQTLTKLHNAIEVASKRLLSSRPDPIDMLSIRVCAGVDGEGLDESYPAFKTFLQQAEFKQLLALLVEDLIFDNALPMSTTYKPQHRFGCWRMRQNKACYSDSCYESKSNIQDFELYQDKKFKKNLKAKMPRFGKQQLSTKYEKIRKFRLNYTDSNGGFLGRRF